MWVPPLRCLFTSSNRFNNFFNLKGEKYNNSKYLKREKITDW